MNMNIITYKGNISGVVWPQGIEADRPHFNFMSWGEVHFWANGKLAKKQKTSKPFCEYTINELQDLSDAFLKSLKTPSWMA